MSNTPQGIVAVVGGGLSGLSAAKAIVDAGGEAIVFEANDRVGGRTLTKTLDSKATGGFGWVDLGGAFVGPSQNAVLGLIDELGIKTYKIHSEQDWLVFANGKRTQYSVLFYKLKAYLFCGGQWPVWKNPFAWWDLVRGMKKFEDMVWKVPHDEPWTCERALEWDSMTVEEWSAATFWTQEAKDFFEIQVSTNVTDAPCQVSLLWYLWYVRSAGGSYMIWNADGGAQERKTIGGSQYISIGLAAKLGSRVLKNSPIASIDFSVNNQARKEDALNCIVVKTIGGEEYRVARVIVATPLPTQNSISYNPPISPRRRQLVQRVHMGMCIKCELYYEKPFWKETGLNGFVSCIGENMYTHNCVDDCVPGVGGGAITVFCFGERAMDLSSRPVEERKRFLGENLARSSGLEGFKHPIHYEDQAWMKEPFIGGCYTSCYPPGVMSMLGSEIRNPALDEAGQQRIFWAGSESATLWTGYMDGAIRAGRRAANEALISLGANVRKYSEADEDKINILAVPEIKLSFWERAALPLPVVAIALFATVPVLALGSAALLTKRSPLDIMTKMTDRLINCWAALKFKGCCTGEMSRGDLCFLLLAVAAWLTGVDALWCYSCVGTHPGCGEVFDYRWHWSRVCEGYDDKCVKIIEKKHGNTLITRGCLSEFEQFRRDIPADRYEGCRSAAKDVKLGHYVNNTIKELDIDRTHYDDVTFCFCDFDERCNSGIGLQVPSFLVVSAITFILLAR
ncbi:unnamed protein product [Notodromas monacha]|uniref:Amine oxidase n=1 Tax=Notodromas monacha TaxID=399045 RepID=A0A7R9BM73_9CRUS|nr:unnamed protein product [Notodromas monacha]CAG0916962.1 unnamed protein product [Notodromas monacha]